MKIIGIFAGSLAIAYGAITVPALAQSTAPITVRTSQSLVGASVGNGVTQGKSVVDVQPKGRPAIGVGALSGKVDHFGTAGSVSVANNARILGVDGPGGIKSPNSLSVANPKQAPILSSKPH